jgi:hypothetical protein
MILRNPLISIITTKDTHTHSFTDFTHSYSHYTILRANVVKHHVIVM